MRREWQWAFVAIVALAVGSAAAEPYARLATSYYALVARWIAAFHPWQILAVDVAPSGPAAGGAVLRLKGIVHGDADGPQQKMRLVAKLQVAAVIVSPTVFWTLLILWPAASPKARLAFFALGIPVFLALEAATTVCQLLNPLAYGSAVIGGDPDPMTSWERWSRFIEGGGRIGLAIAAALCTIAAVQRVAGRSARPS